MQVDKINPVAGMLLVEQAPEERASDSGIVFTENDDDFIAHGEVVSGNSLSYPKGARVVFSVLDGAQGFLDGTKKYAFLSEEKVLAIYEGS